MPSRSEITYFGADPALLPIDVLEKAAHRRIAEHSHRSELATSIINEAKADLASYIDIPEDYEVLFMQGGGSGEFSATMYNLVGAWVTKKKAQIVANLKAPEDDPRVEQELRNAVKKELKTDYIIAGGWSREASEEAKRLLGPEHVNIIADSRQINDRKYGKIPEESTWKLSKDAALVYYCDNETVGVCIAGQVLKKSLSTYNKVEGQEAVSAKNAELIYGALEAHPDVYRIVPDKSVRSRINICFRVTKNGDTDGTEKAFRKEATAQGLTGLKGHRSVGGIRASSYNSIPLEGAEKLAKFIETFATS
ncbi:pyridoxal phosphate-dependent transferase [Fusarium redolens]|uniref:phosphoserine transaminase n=1 Tax=Fusarium redolens TaxID=48865 RepID=A0A9P9H3K8_FUSRE|nr:pyridoxal phosphate-dependent transferase [Fusarium redolens]KAH7249857.1 pyridoxal phosphate-dependent transferase [Fusarium redolens]